MKTILLLRLATLCASVLSVTIYVVLSFVILSLPCRADDIGAEFDQLVKTTYDFKSLSDVSNPAAKEKEFDGFYATIKARKQLFLPYLRTALADKNSNPFFRFDGSNLLVEIDPTLASKSLQASIYMASDIDMIGKQRWVTVLSYRGYDGIDISAAGERWLKEISTDAVDRGTSPIGRYEGALYLYGSMDEKLAVPSLIKLLGSSDSYTRQAGLVLLQFSGTPEANNALKIADTKAFTDQDKEVLRVALIKKPLQPLTVPKMSRSDYLKIFGDILQAKLGSIDLIEMQPNGERNVITVLKPEDLQVMRKARRLMMTSCTEAAIGGYDALTRMISTMVWPAKPAK